MCLNLVLINSEGFLVLFLKFLKYLNTKVKGLKSSPKFVILKKWRSDWSKFEDIPSMVWFLTLLNDHPTFPNQALRLEPEGGTVAKFGQPDSGALSGKI